MQARFLLAATYFTSVRGARVEDEQVLVHLQNNSHQMFYGGKVALAGTPLLEFPREILATLDSNKTVHLGAGSFGESWLVSKGGRQVVMKFLYLNDTGKPRYLHNADCTGHTMIMAMGAKHEYEIYQALHPNQSLKSDEGEKRIMSCFSYDICNMNASASPMYLELENCGAVDLKQFVREQVLANKWTPKLVSSLFKQLLQGLAYLGSFQPVWIHHDLKPDNIVIKYERGEYTLHIIDFGCAVRARDPCAFATGTTQYCPSEFCKEEPHCAHAGSLTFFDILYPEAFDLYSAGSVLLYMLTGLEPAQMFPQRTSRCGYSLDHDYIQSVVVDHSENFLASLGAGQGTLGVLQGLKSPSSQSAHSFLLLALKLFSKTPGNRPSATTLLNHEYMQQIHTPSCCGNPFRGLWKRIKNDLGSRLRSIRSNSS